MAEHEANELRELMEQDLRELTLLLTGIPDAVAGQRPQPDAWSVKEVLAHLSEVTRARFNGVGDLLCDRTAVLAPSAATGIVEKLTAIVATCGTVTGLIARCRTDFDDLANLVAQVSSDFLAGTARCYDGTETTEVEVHAWVRAAYVEEFQRHLSQLRDLRERVRT